MGYHHHVAYCLLIMGLLSLVNSAPSVLDEPGVFLDNIEVLGDIKITHNSIYVLGCKVSEASMEHTVTMEVTINGRQRLTPSPGTSSHTKNTYSCSVHRDYFVYTTDKVEVTCTARYKDGTVTTAQRASPGEYLRRTSNVKKVNKFLSIRCRQYKRAVRNRRVEAWAKGNQQTPGNLTNKELQEQIERARNQAAWKIMKLTKRHLCAEKPVEDNSKSVGSSHNVSHKTPTVAPSLGPQEQEYITKSREVYNQLWEMYQTTDGWHLESGTHHQTPEQGCVHSRQFTGIGKVYRLQGYVDGSPELLFNELVARVTDTPKWSNTVLETRVLQQLDASTSILYTIAAEAAGGFISSRDFVNLNHYASKDGVMVSSASAVTHPDMPPTTDHVRGESGPGGYIFKPVPGNPNKTLLIQMINTDLKGWIPQYVVDQALAGVLIQYHKDVQNRIAHVRGLEQEPATS